MSPRTRLRIEIHGAVQGVGFRPFVYRLAHELLLDGWVLNDARGVFIEVEGDAASLDTFLARLQAERPPLAVIHSLDHEQLPPAGYHSFEIRHSDEAGAKTALVLPDVATCPDCIAEALDPSDRRHRYAFTNCTNCGPRFTIVRALPYDRPNTTMAGFALCPACRAEYEDPRDRRFHAQPTACSACGPRLELWRPTADGHAVEAQGDGALLAAAAMLRAGQIVAVKGLGGFHLMCDAASEAAVALLRERKPRREKPFALMARDLAQVRALCEVDSEEEALLTSSAAPIVLLRRRELVTEGIEGAVETGSAAGTLPMDGISPASAPSVADNVAPGNRYLGVMLPATPLHHLLLRELPSPVVATSGNLSDEPIATDEREALVRLGGMADVLLVHNRPIERHADDSIATLLDGAPRVLRRARGYAPLPVLLKGAAPCVLAVGAHLKNTVALSVGRQVFISQHIGDMETPEALGAFERVAADFLRLYEATPAAVAHDLHPGYASTAWARERYGRPGDPPLLAVQHHHAHLAACLAENHCEGEALGVVWDGTGYGLDGTIWGGEFLLGAQADSRRVAHLRPFRLPGGDAAVREPRRTALALLLDLLGPAALEREDLAPVRDLAPAERGVLARMVERGTGAPLTTSAGRLFDGAAALIGLRQRVSYEGQAAMELEWAADPHERGGYPLAIEGEGGALTLDWRPLIAAILDDLARGAAVGVMSARFHGAMVEAILAVARHIGAPRVALTGGCFLNRLLVERAADRLRGAGFEVLLHRHVPPGDGGISLGQVAAAAARLAG